MYNNYIFDLYGTLIDISTDEKKMEFWYKLSLFYSFNNAKYNPEELKELYLKKTKENAELILDSNYPDFPLENVFRSLYENRGVHPSSELVECTAQFFRISSTDYLKLYDGVIDVLDKLKNKKKKIYLLSNAQKIFTIPEMKILGIYKYFDDIILSSENYLCKPDYKFFNKLISKNNLKVKESIMIGNDPIADIKGAKSVGLDTLYIHSNLSPQINIDQIDSTYKIMSGNLKNLCKLILNN